MVERSLGGRCNSYCSIPGSDMEGKEAKVGWAGVEVFMIGFEPRSVGQVIAPPPLPGWRVGTFGEIYRVALHLDFLAVSLCEGKQRNIVTCKARFILRLSI